MNPGSQPIFLAGMQINVDAYIFQPPSQSLYRIPATRPARCRFLFPERFIIINNRTSICMSISGNHSCNVAHKHRIILARMGQSQVVQKNPKTPKSGIKDIIVLHYSCRITPHGGHFGNRPPRLTQAQFHMPQYLKMFSLLIYMCTNFGAFIKK